MTKLNFRFANKNDADLYFKWANDETVRENSFNVDVINYANHVEWFNKKLNSVSCKFYLFYNELNETIGQVRIDGTSEIIIGISIDKIHRGKNYATDMLKIATEDYFKKNKQAQIFAYIKTNNQASFKSFINAGFKLEEITLIANQKSYKLLKKYDERT